MKITHVITTKGWYGSDKTHLDNFNGYVSGANIMYSYRYRKKAHCETIRLAI